jgi:hypothetical protein
MHLDARTRDWVEIVDLLEDSYRQMAAKRALKALDASRADAR